MTCDTPEQNGGHRIATFDLGLNVLGWTMKIINAIAEDRLLCWAVVTALIILMFELVL